MELDAGGGRKVKADLGAGWIHGVDNNPVVALAEQAGVALAKDTDYDNNQLWLWDGKEVSTAQEAE